MHKASATNYSEYQKQCQARVAPPGQNRRTLPKTRKGKGSCTKRAYRNDAGVALSKTLRKREARLKARQQAQAAIYNASQSPPEGAYRKPGSMTK